MQTHNGVFLVFSFLAQSQDYFSSPGTCPIPPEPSTKLSSNAIGRKNYRAMLHYYSEMRLGEIFVGHPQNEVMNCVIFTFDNWSEFKFSMKDCAIYNAELSWTTRKNYRLQLTNTDNFSSCFNEKLVIEDVYLWTDENKDILIVWICSNGANSSHQELVEVFVNHEKVAPAFNKPFDIELFLEYVKNATTKMLNFTNLRAEAFEVNERMKTDSSCIINCNNNCTVQQGSSESDSVTVYWIVFALICIVVVIAFLIMV